ncbi:Holliday junction resolvase RuvX [Zavarzinia sp. CC-PAN008]|uniref:Holliday junction resolvase RuvX n=1 Tax=Zavarzinia sp. CC-PAN008 TaxID=3243332 RepID=UPI003F749020
MPVIPIEAIVALPGPAMRLAGLDLGTKTIGVALSDLTRSVASPLKVIRRTKFKADAAELLAIAEREGIAAFVLGLPLNMNGTEGPRSQATRAFAANLLKERDVTIAFWDERLSTAAVTRTLLEADASRARRSEVVDKLAAAYILQGVLDYLRGSASASRSSF